LSRWYARTIGPLGAHVYTLYGKVTHSLAKRP